MERKKRRLIIAISIASGLIMLLMALTIDRGALVKFLSLLIALNVFLIIRLILKNEPVAFLLVQGAVLLIFAIMALLV